MPTEMPARVPAAPGAADVSFPWSEASAVVAALDDMAATLRSQLDVRPGMVDTVADWEGSFRDEFDAAHDGLTSRASALADACTTAAGSVALAADDAAALQQSHNARAEEDAAAAARRARVRLV